MIEQEKIVALEEIVAEYAALYGLTVKARGYFAAASSQFEHAENTLPGTAETTRRSG